MGTSRTTQMRHRELQFFIGQFAWGSIGHFRVGGWDGCSRTCRWTSARPSASPVDSTPTSTSRANPKDYLFRYHQFHDIVVKLELFKYAPSRNSLHLWITSGSPIPGATLRTGLLLPTTWSSCPTRSLLVNPFSSTPMHTRCLSFVQQPTQRLCKSNPSSQSQVAN